jgi:hypothetical protein
METASEEGAGRAHRSRRDRGRREPATAEQDDNLVGSDPIVFGFATVDGFHREGMPQDKSQALLCAQVGEPIPGQQALDGHDEPHAVRGDGLEKGFWSGLHVAVQQDFSLVMHEADIQAPRVQINPAVKGVWAGVASPEVFSSKANRRPSTSWASRISVARQRSTDLWWYGKR